MAELNWLAIAVLMLFAAFIVYGWHKGFFRILISFVGTIIIIIATVIISPQVSRFIINNTDIYLKTEQKVISAIFDGLYFPVVTGGISRLMINAGSFVGVYIAFWLILKLLMKSSDLLAKLPVIKTLNKTLGAVIGGAEALIIVWIVFFIIIMFLGNELGGRLLEGVQDSVFLRYLFNNNYLFRFISK